MAAYKYGSVVIFNGREREKEVLKLCQEFCTEPTKQNYTEGMQLSVCMPEALNFSIRHTYISLHSIMHHTSLQSNLLHSSVFVPELLSALQNFLSSYSQTSPLQTISHQSGLS